MPKGVIEERNDDGTPRFVPLTIAAIVQHCTKEAASRFAEHGEPLTPKGESLIAVTLADALHYVDQVQRRSAQEQGKQGARLRADDAPKTERIKDELRKLASDDLRFEPGRAKKIADKCGCSISLVERVRRERYQRPKY